MGIRTKLNPFGGSGGAGGPKVVDVKATPYTTWVLLDSGDLYGCGDNSSGQQGNGDEGTSVATFTKRASNVTQIACDGLVTWYIDSNGDLYGCGYGGYGQQGNNSTNDVVTFTKRASDVKYVACSNYTTWYITVGGDLYGCGYNSVGQQGSGTKGSGADVSIFTKRASNVTQIACSEYTTWYIGTSGYLFGCGAGGQGQQGSGSTSNILTFAQRTTVAVQQIVCSMYTTFYITPSGDLYACGWGGRGQVGSGTSNRTSFTYLGDVTKDVKASPSTTWKRNSGTYNNRLAGCGDNAHGQQGDGTTSNVTDGFNERASFAADYNCSISTTWYIDSNGDLYGCGYGGNGQQGDGNTSSTHDVTTFTKRASNAAKVVCTSSTTWYIDNNGELWGCGSGSDGKQGNGSTNNVFTFENKMQYLQG